ncbi:LPXTG cell wall anchor domain-containing protein [Kitasatospora sp. NPDC127116]|uniref:LPXTG cell wall anchor domain-containing protein n=1 Tax=Kitasatospora sp. NPDC127116 TaxID=3345367 RepID=UPI003641D9F3
MRNIHYGAGGIAASAALAALLVCAPQQASAAPGIHTFDFKGAPEQYAVPDGICELVVRASGGAGGDAVYGSPGGKGGQVRATVQVTSGQVLTVDVGQAGSGGDLSVPGSTAYGGYGGGGQGGSYNAEHRPGNGAIGAGGGGATTVTTGGSALIIAGGGGGGAGSFTNDGTARGGDGGQAGTDGADTGQSAAGKGGKSGGSGGAGGAGGTATTESDRDGFAGGSATGTKGGDAAINVGDPHMGTGGGGGGGAHGGGAGGSSTEGTLDGGGGGGGSSLGPASATFTTGARSGNGQVVIEEVACATPSPSPSPSSTATSSPTHSPSPTATPTHSPSPTVSPTHSQSPTTGPSHTASGGPSPTGGPSHHHSPGPVPGHGGGQLPETGSSTPALLASALLCVGVGAAVFRLARRNGRRRS